VLLGFSYADVVSVVQAATGSTVPLAPSAVTLSASSPGVVDVSAHRPSDSTKQGTSSHSSAGVIAGAVVAVLVATVVSATVFVLWRQGRLHFKLPCGVPRSVNPAAALQVGSGRDATLTHKATR
jgi:hypothetical protein